MRYALGIASLLLLLIPADETFGQSLFGVEVGMPLAEAVDSLRSQGCKEMERNDVGDFSYAYDCLIGEKEVVVAASKDAGSVEEAPVNEVSFVAYQQDLSKGTLEALRDEYRRQWQEKIGDYEFSQRSTIASWVWSTNEVRAEIEYSAYDTGSDQLAVRLKSP